MCHLPEAAAFDRHCLHDVARQIHREHPSRRCPRCSDTCVHDVVNSHASSLTSNLTEVPATRRGLLSYAVMQTAEAWVRPNRRGGRSWIKQARPLRPDSERPR